MKIFGGRSTKFSAITAAQPTDAERLEAKRWPNGFVYRIAKSCGQTEQVPPEAIMGAWSVDQDGAIRGDFILNSNYDLRKWPA